MRFTNGLVRIKTCEHTDCALWLRSCNVQCLCWLRVSLCPLGCTLLWKVLTWLDIGPDCTPAVLVWAWCSQGSSDNTGPPPPGYYASQSILLKSADTLQPIKANNPSQSGSSSGGFKWKHELALTVCCAQTVLLLSKDHESLLCTVS